MRSVALSLALLAVACGGSSPSGPSVPTLPTPTVTTIPAVTAVNDGVSGAPVTGAQITPNGSMVTVSAPGYLTRVQPAAGVVWMWQQPEAYVREMVYDAGRPSSALSRWNATSTPRFAMAPGLGGYDPFLAEMVAELARATRLRMIALPAGSVADVVLYVDAAQGGTGAVTFCNYQGNAIAGGRVYFRAQNSITSGSLLLHELGHTIGLGHSSSTADIMYAGSGRRSVRSFSDDENKTLTMMYQWRQAGNQFPDTAPVGASSRERRTITIACP